MADANLLNSIFDQENFLLTLDKEDFDNRRLEKLEDELGEWFNEDAWNMLLKSPGDYNSLFDLLNTGNEVSNNVKNECSSDSGLSCEQSYSPTRNEDIDDVLSMDAKALKNIPATASQKVREQHPAHATEIYNFEADMLETADPKSFDAVEFVKEEVVEYEEIPFDSVSLVSSNSDASNDVFILHDEDDIVVEDDANDDSEYMMTSPILLSYPDSKTTELVNSSMKYRVARFKKGSRLPLKNTSKKKNSDLAEKDGSDESDFLYPRLQLTPEEQKLAHKEGIKLPSHYPLTKSEERELKRIRRKIRNKISAQDSRRRKKEYVDRLEEKVKRTTEENASLLKRIKTLENQKITLAAQVRKLQASLARCSGQTAQPSTCLLVLIMSLALVLAPTLRNSTMNGENEDEGISLSDDGRTSSLNGMRSPSRNLLFSHKAHEGQCNIEEETKTLTEQLKTMQLPDSKVLSGLLEMLKLKIGKEDSLGKDHDYFRPRKRSATSGIDLWPPSKLMKNSENIINTLILDHNNKSDASNFDNPVVIDILSD